MLFDCALHLQVWLQYQCLWDMQAENIYNRLGEDLNKWQALLVQIRKARGTFDNAETKKEFGPVVIDYGKVSSAVLLEGVEAASYQGSSRSSSTQREGADDLSWAHSPAGSV